MRDSAENISCSRTRHDIFYSRNHRIYVLRAIDIFARYIVLVLTKSLKSYNPSKVYRIKWDYIYKLSMCI